jgi:hypothetical protein
VKKSFRMLIIAAVFLSVYAFVKHQSAGSAIEEIERVRGSVGELLEEREVKNGEVVFYIRENGQGDDVVSADYVKKSFLGWKWFAGGGHTLPAATGAGEQSKTEALWSYQYISAPKGTLSSGSPFPLLFGTVNDINIASVTVKDINSGQETKATLVTAKNGIKLWYAFAAWEKGKTELTGFSSSGEPISVKSVN